MLLLEPPTAIALIGSEDRSSCLLCLYIILPPFGRNTIAASLARVWYKASQGTGIAENLIFSCSGNSERFEILHNSSQWRASEGAQPHAKCYNKRTTQQWQQQRKQMPKAKRHEDTRGRYNGGMDGAMARRNSKESKHVPHE